MWGIAGESSQDTIQVIILLIALLCIPIMLFPKPCIEIHRLKKVKKDYPLLAEELEDDRDNKVNESERSMEKHNSAYNFGGQEEEHVEHDSG